MNIVLKSNELTVKSIVRKTSARLFKDLKVGSKVELSVTVKHAGSNRGQTYSTYIKVRNIDTNTSVTKSFNELPKLLNLFEFEEVV